MRGREEAMAEGAVLLRGFAKTGRSELIAASSEIARRRRSATW
jgi:hypothetical protein